MMGEYADLEIDRQMREMFGIGYEPPKSKQQKIRRYACRCGRHFKTSAGLFDHQRAIAHQPKDTSNDTINDTD